jgi:hypothetical protein
MTDTAGDPGKNSFAFPIIRRPTSVGSVHYIIEQMLLLTYQSEKAQHASEHFYHEYLHKQCRISCVSKRSSATGDTDAKATKKITESNGEPTKE